MKRAFFFSLALLGACGTGSGGDNEPPVTTVGQSVWTPSVLEIVAASDGGGFVPPAPAGSTCQFGAVRYTLGVAARSLAWTRCQGQAPTPYSEVSGNKTLTDAELKDLSQTLGNLRVVGNQGACGADKPLLTIAVRTSGGSVTFADSFYACSIKDKPLLESRAVDATFQKFSALAK